MASVMLVVGRLQDRRPAYALASEQSGKILLHLPGERLERNTAEFGERGVGDGDVGRMIRQLLVGRRWQRKSFHWRRQAHRGRIRFDEQAIGWQRRVEIAETLLA